MDLLTNPAFAVYALAATVVTVQLILLAFYTGFTRATSKTVANPEDTAVVPGASVADADTSAVQRVQRAHQNALENAVPFLALGLLYVLMGASERGAMIYFGAYVGTRLIHSVVYIAGKQPWRTLMFGIGALANLGMAVQIVMAALRHL